ncbi:MAG TPA: hypothetical protein DEB63_19640 [Agrobacterium sp.]|nr:hypothetical protein [Agrobacterium sp.]
MRKPTKKRKPRKVRSKSWPAPVAGWIANQNISAPVKDAPQGAWVLDNVLPTATGGETRRGSDVFATMPTATKPVLSLFSYKNGNQEKLFAANENEIADITTAPVNLLTGRTGGDWSVAQFVNADGAVFLRGVSGMDAPFVFDGASFGTTPALTFPVGITVTADKLSRVWQYKNRLFFIQKESMDAWYLPVSVIGGALVRLPLAGVFARGGSLLFGSSWSIESGDGPNEYCAFVSTEGEVAVFSGSNPGDADDWAKVGVYRIGKPLGAKAFFRGGGDLIIATSLGLVPLSQAMQRDYAALSASAISVNIETAWNSTVDERDSAAWHCEIWPEKQIAVVCMPTLTGTEKQMYVVNTRTAAWSRWTGWDGKCLEVFNGRLLFGSENGKIVEGYVGGSDQGAPYTTTYIPLFEDMGNPLALKIAKMARGVVRTAIPVEVQVTIQTDYIVSLPPVPQAPSIPPSNEWGAAIWGQGVWGAGRVKEIQQDWDSADGEGYAVAPAMRMTSGALVPIDAEIVRIDVTFEVTDIVV